MFRSKSLTKQSTFVGKNHNELKCTLFGFVLPLWPHVNDFNLGKQSLWENNWPNSFSGREVVKSSLITSLQMLADLFTTLSHFIRIAPQEDNHIVHLDFVVVPVTDIPVLISSSLLWWTKKGLLLLFDAFCFIRIHQHVYKNIGKPIERE